MSHRFLKPDPFLESRHLPERTESFLFTLEKDFGHVVFDELCILKKNGAEYRIVYHHCYDGGSCRLGGQDDNTVVREVEFFVENLLKRGMLADHEGVFDLRRDGPIFDVMIHLGDYFFALNNTSHSIRTLESRGVSRGGIIKRIREYCAGFEKTE